MREKNKIKTNSYRFTYPLKKGFFGNHYSFKKLLSFDAQICLLIIFLVGCLLGFDCVADPFDALRTKALSVQRGLEVVGGALVGVSTVAAIILAMFGKFSLKWAVCLIGAGTALALVGQISTWILGS